MPYIEQSRREILDDKFVKNVGAHSQDIGELTYVLYRIALDYAQTDRRGDDEFRFMDVAEAMAAFECAKLEFMRRIGAPYEDTKIIQNGDVVPHGR